MPKVPGKELKLSTQLMRQINEQSVEDKWRVSSANPEYRGRGFLDLLTTAPSRDDRPVGVMQPNSSKCGSFMRRLRYEGSSVVARITRCITNHAPIGTYYQKFNIEAETLCVCGRTLSRGHILQDSWWQGCDHWKSHNYETGNFPGLVKYLKENPTAFAFSEDRPQQVARQPRNRVG